MIVDTSAIVAILNDEPGADCLLEALTRSERPRISAVSYLEAAIVLSARDPANGVDRMNTFLLQADISVLPFDERQAADGLVGSDSERAGIPPP